VLLERALRVFTQRVLVVVKKGIAQRMFGIQLVQRLAPKEVRLAQGRRGRASGGRRRRRRCWRPRRRRRPGRGRLHWRRGRRSFMARRDGEQHEEEDTPQTIRPHEKTSLAKTAAQLYRRHTSRSK